VFSAPSGHFYCYLAESSEIDPADERKSLHRRSQAEYARLGKRFLHCEGGDPFGSLNALREGGDLFEEDSP